MIRREERWPPKSHLHRFPQGCPDETCFWGSFLFSLVPSIDPAANVWWVLAAGPWDPGLWPLSATLPTLQPLLQLCFSAAHIKNCLPIHPSVHISIPLWLGDFGCFSHPRSTMLWHISTWTDTFPAFSSGTCRSLKSRRSRDMKWEQAERASRELKTGILFRGHQKILDASPEGLVIARHSSWHFYFIHSAVHSFFYYHSNRKHLLQAYQCASLHLGPWHTLSLIFKFFKVGDLHFIKEQTVSRTLPVVQRIRICLTMQGVQVQSLIWKGPTCHRATKTHVATTTEPVLHKKPAHRSEEQPTLTTARQSPRAPKTQRNQ